jgi:hypothetical protein
MVVKDEKFESGNKIKHDGWCHECFRKIIIIMIIKLWKSSHIAKETWIRKSKMMKKNEEITSRIGMNLKFRG